MGQWTYVDETHVTSFAQLLRVLPDEDIRWPLWEFKPAERKAVIQERYRRGLTNSDPEPIGDPEYT